ncbi:hypothetical protein [Spirillospora sp. CA-128828]|uniref:hypothetical protein n=1 Tax=Spirillospora sp. CA-128828 TaxID=3240033 RepID=UPI003D94FBA3
MSTVPKAEDSASEDLTDLRAEFPGWTMEAGEGSPSFRASRDGGRGGPLTLGANTRAGLRAALDEVDAVDCRHAAYAMRDVLRARGLAAEVQQLTVATKTRAGILRTVSARRGMYWWGSGVELAPIDDPELAVDRMMPGLGMRSEIDG